MEKEIPSYFYVQPQHFNGWMQ